MKINITSSFDAQKILDKRGIGKDKRLRKYLAGRVRLRADPYVPFQAGTLKNTAMVSKDGAELVYNQPYAHYQYQGEVMGPNFLTKNGWRSRTKSNGGKYYTGRAIQYNGAPMRGKKWIPRMMAEHREDVEKDVAAYIGGNAHDRD